MTTLLQQIVNGLVSGSIYVLMALGLTMIFGVLSIINFAHGEIYMLGGYFTYTLCVLLGVPYLLAMVLAMIAVGMIGIVVEKTLFKPLRGTYFLNTLLVSLGLSIVLQNVVLLLWKPDPRKIPVPYGRDVIEFLGISITLQRFLVIVVTAVLCLCIYYFIKKTKIGKCMRATAQEPEGAALIGVDIDRVFSVTIAVGSLLAAAAGSMIGAIFVIEPAMGIVPVLKAFIVVIVGGFGSLFGALMAGLLLGLTESFAGAYVSSTYMDVISFVILILVLLFRPEGLFGKVES
jgi:branched-chain amino acid transport system permease protein